MVWMGRGLEEGSRILGHSGICIQLFIQQAFIEPSPAPPRVSSTVQSSGIKDYIILPYLLSRNSRIII